MKIYVKSSIDETGIPDSRPTKAQILSDVKKLHGKELSDAISRLDSFGDWYREDKRQKRKHLENVIEYNYYEDPADHWDILDAIDSNDKILYAVYGISQFSTEFSNRFGRYNLDLLYSRRTHS